MKDLRHQHICQLYQVIETDEFYFLVLEVELFLRRCRCSACLDYCICVVFL